VESAKSALELPNRLDISAGFADYPKATFWSGPRGLEFAAWQLADHRSDEVSAAGRALAN